MDATTYSVYIRTSHDNGVRGPQNHDRFEEYDTYNTLQEAERRAVYLRRLFPSWEVIVI